MIAAKSTPLTMTEVTNPSEIAKIEAQRRRFRQNADWLQAHIPQIYSQHRGQFICVAGQELFVDATAPAALAKARQRYPDDDGVLLRYIPREKLERIYAYSRSLDAV